MSDKKKTAVQYLIEEIKNDSLLQAKSTEEWNEVFRKAKQMEREQIIEAWNDGDYAYFYSIEGKEFEDGDEYYEEKFGGQDESNN